MSVGLGPGLPVRRVPKAERQDDGTIRYTVDVGEGEELARKVEARLLKRLEEDERIETRVERITQEGTANVPIWFPLSLWPRFGAKLGLAFGRRVLGEDWALGPEAAHLRDVLWGDLSSPPHLRPLWESIDVTDFLARIAPPPAHLVTVHESEKGAVLIVQLFGQMRYGLQLASDRRHDRWTFWLFDPVRGTAEQTTLDELIRESIERGEWDAAPEAPVP